MPAAWNAPFLSHCYLAVYLDGKPVETFSGQRDEETGLIVWADFNWDLGHLKDPYDAQGDTEYPFSTNGADFCDWLECAFRVGGLISGTMSYNQYCRNSNTFLTRVIQRCAGAADFPLSAIGSDDIGQIGSNVPWHGLPPCDFPLQQ